MDIKYFGFLHIMYLVYATTLAAPNSEPTVTYDQRQSGHYNIHISIKDVAIFDLEGNDFADNKPGMEDYYYDDADFTIKPISSWLTPKPTTSSPITPPSTSSTSIDVGTSTPSAASSSSAFSTSPITSLNVQNNITDNLNSTQQFNSELPRPMFSTKKPNVMIIHSDVSTKKPPTKQIQIPATIGTLIPVQIISDPILQQRRNVAMRPNEDLWNRRALKSGTGLKIAQTAGHGCRRGQIKDGSGNCRNTSRRSSVL